MNHTPSKNPKSVEIQTFYVEKLDSVPVFKNYNKTKKYSFFHFMILLGLYKTGVDAFIVNK